MPAPSSPTSPDPSQGPTGQAPSGLATSDPAADGAESTDPQGRRAYPGRTFRRRALTALSLILTALVVWALVAFVLGHLPEFKKIWRPPIPTAVLALLPLSWLAMVAVNSEHLRRPLAAYGLKIAFSEGLALTMASTAINYLIPLKSGSGLRGLYLAAGRGMKVTDYLALLGSVTAMTLTAASFFAFLGLACLWAQGHRPDLILPLYFGGTAILGFC